MYENLFIPQSSTTWAIKVFSKTNSMEFQRWQMSFALQSLFAVVPSRHSVMPSRHSFLPLRRDVAYLPSELVHEHLHGVFLSCCRVAPLCCALCCRINLFAVASCHCAVVLSLHLFWRQDCTTRRQKGATRRQRTMKHKCVIFGIPYNKVPFKWKKQGQPFVLVMPNESWDHFTSCDIDLVLELHINKTWWNGMKTKLTLKKGKGKLFNTSWDNIDRIPWALNLIWVSVTRNNMCTKKTPQKGSQWLRIRVKLQFKLLFWSGRLEPNSGSIPTLKTGVLERIWHYWRSPWKENRIESSVLTV